MVERCVEGQCRMGKVEKLKLSAFQATIGQIKIQMRQAMIKTSENGKFPQ